MVTITCAAPEAAEKQRLVFRVRERAVLFAGSRNGFVDPELADRLVTALAGSGFSFLVGCATGVDACFRLTLAERPHAAESTLEKPKSGSAPASMSARVSATPTATATGTGHHRGLIWRRTRPDRRFVRLLPNVSSLGTIDPDGPNRLHTHVLARLGITCRG
jgi:hypothetical protein